ncbi:hypothetical protein B0I37DRAFT_360968 [Chaetomium sp. MPI-CAGE-AT-0009]|nr:hypothetical protein B0I37DRAFT_360968 [Chaetomium sp. MPI-CAGE-AT-0009]
MKTLTNIPEQCIASERGRNWPVVLSLFRYLPAYLRCPGYTGYFITVAFWFVVLLYQIARQPPFFPDCMLPISVAAMLARMFGSMEAMLIVCVVGVTVALLVLKPLGWAIGSEWKRKSLTRDTFVRRQST